MTDVTRRLFLCQRCFVASEEAAVAWVDERVDGSGRFQYIDKLGSVSALVEVEVDSEYVQDHNRLFLEQENHHGS